jgi:hypothetical protein
MTISSNFKSQLSFNWHLNLNKVCATQSLFLYQKGSSSTAYTYKYIKNINKQDILHVVYVCI